jgi:hypothetical protein
MARSLAQRAEANGPEEGLELRNGESHAWRILILRFLIDTPADKPIGLAMAKLING